MRCPACFSHLYESPACSDCGYTADNIREGSNLPLGTKLRGGEYVVGKVLGKPGGFGMTYLAWDSRLDIKVAIKEYLPFQIAARSNDRTTVSVHTEAHTADFQFGLEKFLEEAKTLAQFRHPNIIRVLNYFQQNGTAYMVMDYLEGESLAEYLDRTGKLKGHDAVAILSPLLDGLAYVHSKNFLHRDIKPANIYLTTEGQAVLLDFGSARQTFTGRSKSLTSVVTAGFAPWEQYSRKGRQGPWTDVYSCAATLYFMLTGQIPPDATERTMDDDIVDISELEPALDAKIAAAIMKGLTIDIEGRFQTAKDFKETLVVLPEKAVSERTLKQPSHEASAELAPESIPVARSSRIRRFITTFLLCGLVMSSVTWLGIETLIKPQIFSCKAALAIPGKLERIRADAKKEVDELWSAWGSVDQQKSHSEKTMDEIWFKSYGYKPTQHRSTPDIGDRLRTILYMNEDDICKIEDLKRQLLDEVAVSENKRVDARKRELREVGLYAVLGLSLLAAFVRMAMTERTNRVRT